MPVYTSLLFQTFLQNHRTPPTALPACYIIYQSRDKLEQIFEHATKMRVEKVNKQRVKEGTSSVHTHCLNNGCSSRHSAEVLEQYRKCASNLGERVYKYHLHLTLDLLKISFSSTNSSQC